MRGEHFHSWLGTVHGLGSSPHARGTLLSVCLTVCWQGIIPACAGNTRFLLLRYRRTRDHPRMRGEHKMWLMVCFIRRGSSPHARGTRFHVREVVEPFGIIPACAGNTWCLVCWCCVGWDHPRMRGEHVRTAWRRLGNRGSSPHARGTLGGRRVFHEDVGIIPACAGNTSSRLAYG